MATKNSNIQEGTTGKGGEEYDDDDIELEDVSRYKYFVEFNMSPELKQGIYKDWALYYKRRNMPPNAVKNFKKALLLNPNDVRSHMELSECKYIEADCKGALKSAEKALKIKHGKLNAKYNYVQSLYINGLFETSLVKAHRAYARSTSITNKTLGKDFVDTAWQTVDQAIGFDAGPCLFQARKTIKNMISQEVNKFHNNKLMWKHLKEKNECDVESDCVVKKSNLKLQCQKRRALNFTVVNHMFFDASTGNDIAFLNELIKDKKCALSQLPSSTANLDNALRKLYGELVNFKTIIKTRHPLYAKRFLMINDENKAALHKEENLFKVQHQTRRDVFRQLNDILKLYHHGIVRKLCNYVEDIMSNYYSIKRPRVFPRKFVFLSEIYNIVSLAYAKEITIPIDLMEIECQNRLFYILNIPTEQYVVPVAKIFGDKKTYRDPDALDTSHLPYIAKITHFEERCGRIEYPIELCYLYHEIGIIHLMQNNVHEATNMSKNVINASKACGNCVWEFLGYMMNIRSLAMQQNPIGVKFLLSNMATLTNKMNESIQTYIETMTLLVVDDIFRKEKQEQEQKRKSERW